MDRETREFLERQFAAIDQRFTRVDAQFQEMRQDVAAQIQGVRQDVTAQIQGVR